MARKSKNQDIEEIDKSEVEVDEKEDKKKKREEAAEKRRKERKKDKAARWSGIILLTIIMIVGFLMWVSGEIGSEDTKGNLMPVGNGQSVRSTPNPSFSTSGKVIVK